MLDIVSEFSCSALQKLPRWAPSGQWFPTSVGLVCAQLSVPTLFHLSGMFVTVTNNSLPLGRQDNGPPQASPRPNPWNL